jgi:hypothetical protein
MEGSWFACAAQAYATLWTLPKISDERLSTLLGITVD